MRQYIVRAQLYSAWNSMLECVQQYVRVRATVLYILMLIYFEGGSPVGPLIGKSQAQHQLSWEDQCCLGIRNWWTFDEDIFQFANQIQISDQNMLALAGVEI